MMVVLLVVVVLLVLLLALLPRLWLGVGLLLGDRLEEEEDIVFEERGDPLTAGGAGTARVVVGGPLAAF